MTLQMVPFSRAELIRWTRDYLANLLHIKPEDIRLDRGLVDLGIDSADAIIFSGEMEERFGIVLEPRTFLEVETLQEMVEIIVSANGEAA